MSKSMVEQMEKELLNNLTARQIVELTKVVTGKKINTSLKNKKTIINQSVKVFADIEDKLGDMGFEVFKPENREEYGVKLMNLLQSI